MLLKNSCQIQFTFTLHIEKKILNNAKTLKKSKKIMPHWSKLVKILTPSDFYAYFQRFSALYNPQFIKYIKKVWIPLASWFFNAWTKQIPHFYH